MVSYIRGRLNIACIEFIDELKSMGISAAVGHGRRAEEGLTVVCHDPRDIPNIPNKFNGLLVTEVISQVDFDHKLKRVTE